MLDLNSDLQIIADNLTKNNWQLCTAESCTGGKIASAITSLSGCSSFFCGGFVCYATTAKVDWLGISNDIIAKYGVVSTNTVDAMLDACLQRQNIDVAIASSGIAGPESDSSGKAVGTVVIGVTTPNFRKVQQLNLSGSREQVINQAVVYAITTLAKAVANNGLYVPSIDRAL